MAFAAMPSSSSSLPARSTTLGWPSCSQARKSRLRAVASTAATAACAT